MLNNRIDKMTDFESLKLLPKLSERQKECLSFIASYVQKNRDYPTQKEISCALRLKSNSAWGYTEALKKKGYLTVTKNIGVRNLRLTKIALEFFNENKTQK